MSRRPVIITPAFVRKHNLRCLGRIALAACGAGAVYLVVFIFAWLVASVVTQNRELSGPVIVFASLVGFAVFALGHLYLARKGPQDWEKIAQKRDRKPGMRLGRMSNQDYGQIGQGFLGLVLAGPGWISKIVDEWGAMMPATDDFADKMESLRQHFAARDSWVPMRDFSNHEADIYLLTRLNILAVRELLGEWHFHVTVEGTAKRESAKKAGK